MAKGGNVSSARYETQMRGLRKQLEGMTPAEQSGIEQDLIARVDAFRPQYQELAGLESGAYLAAPRLMQQYQNNYGNIGGPGALSRLSSIMGNIGQQYGTSDALANIITAQRGRIEDMSKSAMQQYGAERDALSQQYDMYNPLFQAATSREDSAATRKFQAAEAAKQRKFQAAQNAASRAASRSYGGGSSRAASSLLNFPSSPSKKVTTKKVTKPKSNNLQGGNVSGSMLQDPGAPNYNLVVRK